jgi:SNF2 family DNA or RNA helicase
MTEFQFKTQPYQHQLKIFEDSKDQDYAAYFLEMRTGKSKLTLDVAAYQFHDNKIDALLIISPNGVARNWVTEEVPTHLHDNTNYRTVLWQSGRMGSQKAQQDLDELLIHRGLAVLAVNVDALITDSLKAYLVKFFKRRKVFSVVDESVDISSPGAARARVAMRIGARSVSRRILDGTPVAAKPLGLYSQCAFLKPGLLGESYHGFKQRYAEWEAKDVGERNKICTDCGGNGVKTINDEYVTCPRCKGQCFIGKNTFLSLKKYQRLDELSEKLAQFSYRVRRDQCADMPPKIRTKRFFALSKPQQRVYDDLRETYQAELASGEIVTAQMALTRLLRLQQVTSNFLPINGMLSLCSACHGEGCEQCNDEGVIGTKPDISVVNPMDDSRLSELRAVLEPLEGQGIIWCRFTHDVAAVFNVVSNAVRYDGAMHADARAMALRKFQQQDARLLVGTAQAGGRGLDLSGANFVIYYSHSWSLRQRLQSEDRAQSLKKSDSVLYVDLIAENTVDERIIDALRGGRELSAMVLGDPKIFD